MDRAHGKNVVSGWPALLLAPIVIPFIIAAALLERLGWIKSYGSDFGPAEVAGYLRRFLDGTSDDWDWDDFENMRLNDSGLEAIRQEAVMAGPPDADIAKLGECLARTEALAAQARMQALTHQPG